MNRPELLSPAGTLKNMRFALAYGADAVYAGQPRYSLRVRNNDFKDSNLEVGINQAHALGKKFYLTSNLMPHNSKVKTYIRDLEPVIELGPDALIMADPGLIMMVRPPTAANRLGAVRWGARSSRGSSAGRAAPNATMP